MFMRNNKLLACAWHDTKRITVLSSVYGNKCSETEVFTKKGETGFCEVKKPLSINRYNSFMGGLDTADQ